MQKVIHKLIVVLMACWLMMVGIGAQGQARVSSSAVSPLPTQVVYASKAGLALNGTTDDSAALQTILNRATSGLALELVVDKGTLLYKNVSVNSNTTIRTLAGAKWLLAAGATYGLRNANPVASWETGMIAEPSGVTSTGPTAPTDHDITLIGGLFDGNRRTNWLTYNGRIGNAATGPCVMTIQMYGVKNLTLQGVSEYDSPTYGIHVSNVQHLVARDCHVENPTVGFGSNQDGFHINGPADDVEIDNLTIVNAGDDSLALNADDGHEASQNYPNAFQGWVGAGPIRHVRVNGLYLTRCLAGIRLLSAPNTIDDVVISNAHGTAMYQLFLVDTFAIASTGDVRRVTLDNFDITPIAMAPDTGTPSTTNELALNCIYLSRGHINNLTIRNASLDMFSTRPWIRLSSSSAIDQLTIDGLNINDTNSAAVGVLPVTMSSGSLIKQFSVRGVNWYSNYAQTGSLIYNQGTINTLAASNIIIPSTSFITGTAATLQTGDAITSSGTGSSLMTGLAAYWSLNEAANVTRVDALGASNLLDTNANVGAAAAILNGGASFSAGTTQILQCASNGNISFASSMTVSCWVYLNAKTSTQVIMSKDNSADSLREYFLDFDNSSQKFVWQVTDSSNNHYQAVSVASPSANAWHHIVAYYDAPSSKIAIVVDNGTPNVYSASSSIRQGTSNLCFGNWLSTAAPLNGIMDEVGIWSRKLSSTEITSLYNAGAGHAYPF